MFRFNMPRALLTDDRGLFRATAVTRVWNITLSKGKHRKLTLKKKILPPLHWSQYVVITVIDGSSSFLTRTSKPVHISSVVRQHMTSESCSGICVYVHSESSLG